MRPLAGTEIVRVSRVGTCIYAQVAELVDALASGASGRKVVGVQVSPWAPSLLSVLLEPRNDIVGFRNQVRRSRDEVVRSLRHADERRVHFTQGKSLEELL